MKLKKAGIYIRVSTDFQAEEGYSIDAQKEQLAAYCVAKAIKNYEFYIDGGWSGSNTNRPELQRLIADTKKGKISHCIVYKLDRLSRSQKDTLYLIEDIFIPNNVTFISLNENLDTESPTGKMMIGILSAFAQLERETIRMRTRMGMLERVKSGYWMGGGRVPFGYDYDRTLGILVPNKDEEKVVKKIFELYLDGYSQLAIYRSLNLKGEKLVQNILSRKTYIGIIEYNGIEYQGKHTPIIDKEMFEKVQHELKSRSVPFTGGTKLLTGLLYCGKCGAKMRYQKWGKSGDKICCYSKDKSKPYLIKDENCTQENIWAHEVEDVVINDLLTMSIKKRKRNEYQKENILSVLENEKRKLETKIKKLFNLYADGDELLLETINENKLKLSEIEAKIKIENEYNILQKEKIKLIKSLDNLSDFWEYSDIFQKKTLIRSIIDKIIITDNHIEIFYKI